MEERYYCPLMEEEIDDGICFDIHCVVGGNPKWIAPQKIFEKKEYIDICLKCPHHRDDA